MATDSGLAPRPVSGWPEWLEGRVNQVLFVERRDPMALSPSAAPSSASAPGPVLPGVDIEIADREFVTLVGPSGCGKSTLLHMIAGLESVTTGEIAIGGERVNEMPADLANATLPKRGIAFGSQERQEQVSV